jgi:very-short-patch-repair endonuclease
MTQTELQKYVSQTDTETQNSNSTETEDAEQFPSDIRDTVRLKYCGCTELRKESDRSNYYLPIQQFHEEIVGAIAEHNHSDSDVPNIESVENFIDGDAIRPPNDEHSVVLTLAENNRDGLTSNRQSIAYVGNLKCGDVNDGRTVINNQTLSKDSHGKLNLDKKFISGPTTPSAVNIWAGDGTIAIEHTGFEATVRERKNDETDYFLSVGVPEENVNSNYAASIEYKSQFKNYAIAGNKNQTISYETIANSGNGSEIIGTIDDASNQPKGINIDPPSHFSTSINIGINEAIVKELGVEIDKIPEYTAKYPDHKAPVVKLIPRRGGAADQYIIRKKSLDKKIQTPAVNPKKVGRDNKYDMETFVQFVRRAANECSEPLGAREYNEWAKKQKKDEPDGRKNNGTQTTMGESRPWPTPDIHKISRESSYTDVCEAAGVTSRRRGKTDIEEQLEEIMGELGISYINQKEVPKYDDAGHYTVDIFVPKQKLVIEADGIFWHGHPKKYTPDEDTEYERYFKDAIKRDSKRNKEMEMSGYDVIRFWGDTIRNTPEDVRDKIDRVIRGNSTFEHGKHPFGPEPRLE